LSLLFSISGSFRAAAESAAASAVTFSLYKESEGGAALWMEAQKVEADAAGL
jgi:hypothetical protein